MAKLHEVLQIAFGSDDEHLNRFEIRGRELATGSYEEARVILSGLREQLVRQQLA